MFKVGGKTFSAKADALKYKETLIEKSVNSFINNFQVSEAKDVGDRVVFGNSNIDAPTVYLVTCCRGDKHMFKTKTELNKFIHKEKLLHIKRINTSILIVEE